MFLFPYLGGGWMFGRGNQKGQPYVGGGLGLGIPVGLSAMSDGTGQSGPSTARFAADDGAADQLLSDTEAKAPSQSIETPSVGGPSV